jgi:uncharacterized LabA/DUF88 family protein
LTSKEDKRVMIFIDGSNLFWGCDRYSQKNNIKFRVDIWKLIELYADKRDFIRAHYYASTKVPPLDSQTRFYDKLQKGGIIVRKKPLIKGKEKGIDVWLVTDLLSLGFRKCYDVAIVFSGDRDLCSAYDQIRDIGLLIEVSAFAGDYNQEILMHCDKFIELDKYTSQIKY